MQHPWIEAMLLELGAANVVTLEYNEIESQVKGVTALTPQKIREMWRNRLVDQLNFDVIVSYSSLEHSGMGRFGDPLNPWGDLIASAQSW